MQRARRVTPLRAAVTALAVVLGILAMHAVSGGPHSPRGVQHTMAGPATHDASEAVAALSAPAALLHAVEVTVGDAVSAASGPAAVLATWSAPAPDLDPGAMAAMCAAVLFVLVLALGFGVLGRTAPLLLRAGTTGTLPGRLPVSRAPPRDLLTELCVLRT